VVVRVTCSYDSLEGLFFDDSYRPRKNTLEYTTSSPQGACLRVFRVLAV